MRFGISNDELSFSINKPSTRFVLSEQRLNKEKEAALSKSRAYLQKFDENLKLNKKKLKEELDLSIARIEAEQLAKIKNLTITTTSPRQVLENKDPIFTQYIDAILPTNWLFDNLDKSLEFEPERYGLEWDDELNKYSEIKEKLVPKTVLGKIDDNSQNMPYDICKGLPSQFSTFSKDICSGLLPQNNALSKNILAQPIKQNDQKMVADIEFPKSTFIDVMENEYNASSKAGLVLNGKEVLASERAFKTWIRQFFNSDRALDKEDFKAVIRHVNEFKTCFLPIEGSELYEHVKLLHSSRGGLDASLFDIFTIMMSTLRLDTSIYVWMCEILYISIKDNVKALNVFYAFVFYEGFHYPIKMNGCSASLDEIEIQFVKSDMGCMKFLISLIMYHNKSEKEFVFKCGFDLLVEIFNICVNYGKITNSPPIFSVLFLNELFSSQNETLIKGRFPQQKEQYIKMKKYCIMNIDQIYSYQISVNPQLESILSSFVNTIKNLT